MCISVPLLRFSSSHVDSISEMDGYDYSQRTQEEQISPLVCRLPVAILNRSEIENCGFILFRHWPGRKSEKKKKKKQGEKRDQGLIAEW